MVHTRVGKVYPAVYARVGKVYPAVYARVWDTLRTVMPGYGTLSGLLFPGLGECGLFLPLGYGRMWAVLASRVLVILTVLSSFTPFCTHLGTPFGRVRPVLRAFPLPLYSLGCLRFILPFPPLFTVLARS